MKSRYEVILNGIALSSLNENLYISDISYPSPAVTYSIKNYAGRNGGRVSSSGRIDESSVTVTFELHIYGTQARQAACAHVIDWAKNGGVLQTSDRVDQTLTCICTKMPSVESAMRWTDQLSLTFTAYEVPFWRSTFVDSATVTNGSGTLFTDGNADTWADVTVTANGAVTGFSVTFGQNTITLSGLSLASGDTVIFSHDESGILSITAGNVSVLSKRTAASADDLTAPCGTIQIAVDGNVTAEFRVRGAWI